MNYIIIHGRLTKDVTERDYTNREGKTGKMATFSVAVDKRVGEGANYFDCTAFGKLADLIATHFHQGQEIVLRGEMNMTDREKDGVKRRFWNVNVDTFDFCGRKADNAGSNKSAGAGESFEDVQSDVPF